jgi:hypothetical protein
MPPLAQSEGEGNKALSPPTLIGPGKTMAIYSVVLTGSNQMQVNGNRGEVAFNVTNTTGSPLQTRFDLGRGDGDKPDPSQQTPWHPTLPADSPLRKWLTVQTPPCRIDPKGTVQVIVKLQAPPETEGSYRFCIIAAAAPRTDEDFTTGPPVSFALAKTGEPPPPPFRVKWWMILIAVVIVLAIAGGILALVLSKGGVPNVVGKSADEAKQVLEKAGLQVKTNDVFSPGKTDGTVLDQKPASGAAEPADKIVVLDVVSTLATVPCVEGMSLSAAAAQLKAAGLQFDATASTTEGTVGLGFVASQNPRNEVCTPHAAGLRVAPGSKVFLTIKR